MAELSSSKYSVAWFKLAEFISRKEKERALGIYRLLAHSLQNEALSCQLEGDIHLSFDDIINATNCYLRAANIYQNNNNYIASAAIYEHLTLIRPNNIDYAVKTYKLYAEVNNSSKIKSSLKILINSIYSNNKINDIDSIALRESLSSDSRLMLYEAFILYSLEHETISQFQLYKYIEPFIEITLKIDKKRLDNFIDKLNNLNPKIFEYALLFLESLE